MNYKMVVFDIAGTTVVDNFDVHRVLIWALRKHGITVTIEQATSVMGIPKPMAIRQLLQNDPNGKRLLNDETVLGIHNDFIDEMVQFYCNDAEVREKAGVSKTFQELQSRGIKVALDTGFDRTITNALLARLGWVENGLIDCCVTSDEVMRGRPFPDMILKAMRICKIEFASDVIKVGDTLSDILEGRAASCGMVVAVTTGAFSAEELRKANPDFLIEEVSEIIPLMESRLVLH